MEAKYHSPEETIPSVEPVVDDTAEYGILPPELRERLREDLDFIPDDPAELRRAVRDMAAHINHADWRFIKLIAAMDCTRGWTEAGYATLGNWLDHRCGLGPCAARERIRIGRALRRLPRIDAAFRDGVLSYSKVRALKLRDHNRCRFPGCAHQRYVEAHHVRHWIDGGETRLDNLVLLCSAHHRLLHHKAFRIVVEDDGLVFVSRHGEVIEPALRPQFPPTPPPVFPRKRDRLDLDLPHVSEQFPFRDAGNREWSEIARFGDRPTPPGARRPLLKRAGGALSTALGSGKGILR